MKVRRTFTLIELLVVVSIIAVLASLLLPALTKARSHVKRAACLSNQRQLGIYATLYAEEHDGWFMPTHWVHKSNLMTTDGSDPIEYLGNDPDLLRCPSYRFLGDTPEIGAAGLPYWTSTDRRFSAYTFMAAWGYDSTEPVEIMPDKASTFFGWSIYNAGYRPTGPDSQWRTNIANLRHAERYVDSPGDDSVKNAYVQTPVRQAMLLDAFGGPTKTVPIQTTWYAATSSQPSANNHSPDRGINILFLDLHGRWSGAHQQMAASQKRVYTHGWQYWEDTE